MLCSDFNFFLACSLTILVGLDDHGIGRLAFDRLKERNQEEIVFVVLSEVGQCVGLGLTVVHHYRHHVIGLRAAR